MKDFLLKIFNFLKYLFNKLIKFLKSISHDEKPVEEEKPAEEEKPVLKRWRTECNAYATTASILKGLKKWMI